MKLGTIPFRLSKRFALQWGVGFAVLVGAVGGVAALFPSWRWSMFVSFCLVAGAAVFSGFYAWHVTRPAQLPDDDILPHDATSAPCATIETSVERTAVLQVNQIAQLVYPGIRPIPVDRYEQWMMINPNILVCLFDGNGRVVGYFDVFPLRSDFMRMLIEGRCGEQDIRREHILSPKEAATAKQLYLAGIAITERATAQGRRYASMLVWGLVNYLEHFYRLPLGREIFAEAVTPEGERLLRKFHFEVASEARGRRDPFPLFRRPLTPGVLELARKSIPDWSRVVRLSWSPRRPGLKVVRQSVA